MNDISNKVIRRKRETTHTKLQLWSCEEIYHKKNTHNICPIIQGKQPWRTRLSILAPLIHRLMSHAEGVTGVMNLIVSSSSPDSTPRSRNQTFCTSSPLTLLILLSRTRQFSLSGTSFLIVVSPEETRKMSRILAAETKGWRLRKAFPILSSLFKRSLSNTSYMKNKLALHNLVNQSIIIDVELSTCPQKWSIHYQYTLSDLSIIRHH